MTTPGEADGRSVRPLRAVRPHHDEDRAAARLDAREEHAARLMAMVARGNEQAFADLFTMLSPTLYGLVRRVLRDPAQSEEVAQEVFVEIWRTASRFDRSKGAATTWCCTLAHRRAVDRVRSEQARSHRQERAASDAPVTDAAAEAEVMAVIEADLEAARVQRALATLTDLQREAIELAFYRGYTYPEVAQLLDVPLGTVKTRIRDGLIRLRDELGVGA